ncbi:MAG: SpoIIE family protein phosphatase [Bdellovibrionaceae bacterium]|nr:SpoIIE family protein phosphatase [Pseudobdellovibrionaceae bacterium]
MTKNPIEHYQNRVKELEVEIVEREKDLAIFRRELGQVNRQLEELIARLSRDLKVAQEIQRILVPTEFPNIQGIEFSYKFIPSSIKGGDYFDIFEHEDKFRFGLIIASGSGHGMSALLLSVLLNITAKMEARRGAEPHKIIELIYSELAHSLGTNDKADLFYALIDRRSFEMSYLNLGAVVAMYHDSTSGELSLLEGESQPLMLNVTLPKASQTKVLSPRDRIILATPGVYSCKNLEGEEFGQERLFKSILSSPKQGVHDLRNEVFISLKKFATGVEPPRDQSLVVAEVKDRVIKLAK